jgi:hypothetical protein
MTWSTATAGLIIQSGTDADITGLNGLASVTTRTEAGRTIYDIDGRRLRITGTLTLNPWTHGIRLRNSGGVGNAGEGAVSIQDNGSLTITGSKTVNGQTFYTTESAIEVNDVASDGDQRVFRVGTFNGTNGTLTMTGSRIYAEGRIEFNRGTVTLTEAIIDGNYDGTGARRCMVRTGMTLTVNGLTLIRNYLDPSTSTLTLTNFKPVGTLSIAGFFNETSTAANELTVNGYQTIGSAFDFGAWNDGSAATFTKSVNAVNGSVVTVGTPYNSVQFCLTCWQKVGFTVTSLTEAAISGATVYLRDTNDNRRHNANGRDYTADRTYTWTTNGAGVAAAQEVLLATRNGDLTSAVFSYRGINGTNDDNFTYKVRHYSYVPKSGTTQFRSSTDMNIKVAVATDANAVLTSAAAAALTGIAITKATGTASTTNPHIITITDRTRTLDEIYCYWKQWFCLAAQADTNDQLTVTAGRLVLGNYRIVEA